jgi:hypothetical protein
MVQCTAKARVNKNRGASFAHEGQNNEQTMNLDSRRPYGAPGITN